MGKIFYIMGKSASGKDSIYKALINDASLNLKGVVLYATRPIRPGEINGKDYFFITPEEMDELEASGRVIERRIYDTVYGPWHYATIDDGQIDLTSGDYLMVGVLSAFVGMKKYFGQDNVVPLYIEVEDGERLQRALDRDRNGAHQYEEMCRRFLADCKDFSEEKLMEAGIDIRYQNSDFNECLAVLRQVISGMGN